MRASTRPPAGLTWHAGPAVQPADSSGPQPHPGAVRPPAALGRGAVGHGLFWATDAFATWAGLATFVFQMNMAALFVGFATGMLFTRRTGPLASVGVLALVLPLTIWVSGAPFPAAIAGVFVYRMLALLLPMPVSLAVLPTLRALGRGQGRGQDEAQGATPAPPTGEP